MTKFLNSPAPFRPVNAWGRAMPKPKREMKKALEPLYQVVVEARGHNEPLPVGPMVIKQVAEQFCAAINTNIAKGRERDWANPHLVPAMN